MDAVEDYASSSSDSGGERDQTEGEGSSARARPPPPFAPAPALAPAGRRVLLHVFAPAPSGALSPLVGRLLARARLQCVGRSVKASFCAHGSLHVSLSRACDVEEGRVPQVVAEVRGEMARMAGGTVEVEERVIALASQNGSRLFVAAPVSGRSARGVVMPLVRAVDAAFGRVGLQKFYERPVAHVSFASTSETGVGRYFRDGDGDGEGEGGECARFAVREVVCEAGHRQYSFALRSGGEED